MVVISLMLLIIAIALTPATSRNSNAGGSVNQISIHSPASLIPQGKAGEGRDVLVGGISPILFTRLASIVFLFSGALAYNAFYIQSIGSGISIYSGLFHVSVLSQSFDVILYILASLILIPWSLSSSPSHEGEGKDEVNRGKVGFFSPSTPVSPLGTGAENSAVVGRWEEIGPKVKEYSLIVLFSTLGSSLLLSSGNLLSLYLSLELQSFGVYILASIYRDSESATNAGLKYFLLGGLSSCIILLGCVLIYSYTGITNFEDINSLLISLGDTLPAASDTISAVPGVGLDIVTIVQLGLILIFIGFLFKIAGAPFHNWAPDVYNDVPSIVTTWLTIMPKIAIIILSVDIISTINLDLITSPYTLQGGDLIRNLLLISSFLSLIIGTVVGLAQTKIKRLLAYSTISHVGFMLLALSVNTEESLESVIFYLIQYSFTNLNIFFIILAFGYIISAASSNPNPQGTGAEGSDISFISELKGQFKNNPLLTLSLAVSLFSMAGIPPLLGFFAKAGVLYSSTQNGYYFISLIAIVVSVISAYYYLAIVKVMHFDSSSQSIAFPQGTGVLSHPLAGRGLGIRGAGVGYAHSFIISILTLSILLFILKPSIILNSIHLIALNIFYF